VAWVKTQPKILEGKQELLPGDGSWGTSTLGKDRIAENQVPLKQAQAACKGKL
jgi:hypothetical protein